MKSAKKDRAECMKLIDRLVGTGGREAFLATPQPAIEDQTGRELLDECPLELLARLREIEGGLS